MLLWLTTTTNYQQQEALYKTAISLFTRGKYWEKAIELLEELRHQYQHVTCEFLLLADILVPSAPVPPSLTSKRPSHAFGGADSNRRRLCTG
jgi:hypothetical protein